MSWNGPQTLANKIRLIGGLLFPQSALRSKDDSRKGSDDRASRTPDEHSPGGDDSYRSVLRSRSA
ncbi:MAG: hypothetical protein AAB408_02310 [Patescibacteria group bacterium]